LAGIAVDEHLVEVLHLLHSIGFNVAEAQLLHHLLSNFISHSLFNVHWLYNDVFVIYIFYFHPTEFTGNDARALGVPVLDEGQVDFA